MIKLFTPNRYIKSYRSLDIVSLKKQGIKLIICDIDNTLVAHDETLPNSDVKKFVSEVQEQGLQICLISNNHLERVKEFANALQLHYYEFAKKPLKGTYRKILKDYNVKPKDIASIGDQLLTDVFGGNRMRIYTILTHPLVERDLKATKINRRIETYVFKRLEKKKLLTKGVFDE